MATTPSPGWAVELTGDRIDLDDLRELLVPPFDPWVEDYDEGDGVKLLLRSQGWAAAATTSSTIAAQAARIVHWLNGAALLVHGDARPVALGRIMWFGDDGSRVPVIVAASGHYTFRGGRMRGRGVAVSVAHPLPPKASPMQGWIKAAEGDDDRADLFEHLARADNWYDIYKSAEIIRRIAKRKGALDTTLGEDKNEWDHVWRTANANRHAPNDPRFRPPPRPATLDEARQLIFKVARMVA